jgi:hypothetical protein
METMMRPSSNAAAGLASVLWLGVFAPCAFAASAGGVMNELGLAGTWSPDCTRAVGQGVRITFSVPAIGVPTRSTIVGPEGGHLSATTEAEIENATRVADDKIRLIMKFTEIKTANGGAMPNTIHGDFEMIVQKVGARINVIGQKGQQIFYEKCN